MAARLQCRNLLRQFARSAFVQPSRTYATIPAPPPAGLHNPSIKIDTPAHTNTTGLVPLKGWESRKTYLLHNYAKLLLEQPLILIAQHNAVNAEEWGAFRNQVAKVGGKLQVIRTHIFKAGLRNVNYMKKELPQEQWATTDATAQWLSEAAKDVDDPLMELFVGPLATITLAEPAQGFQPEVLKKVMDICNKSQNKLVLLGGRMESSPMDLTDLERAKALPNLEGMRAQLLGLLSSPASGLGRVLSASGSRIYFTLESRRIGMEKEANPEGATAEEKA
ncbi:hypothetical protein SAICODRAFT_71395 [Saitoella complicata NRRL Y-17804]|uniref:Ribosomal protein L10 n=1 Tax=Saitoella complicata (strain BCRC 22490 / CBS 7301 / JCM 7358 / NBRC 10748 / NRRL Y-17804) TaxID=698492 RepID=A0A0E9NI14_SAICN|nr:uncharacterized protein SAICODRAFT_71395 [Saitoella complicata NRRL Y-17804]ODQ52983.1 hypothetical protein SAICODRAFT_71395 [Saitoella complicata NRRL Y-17804]GAO49050.1 hypothetical protein G7K_3211-t1 [Saitoella complicata NRRL Y-17804]